MNVFVNCSEQALVHLSQKDEKLGEAITRIGVIERKVNPCLFSAMVGNIISQQISGKAADTIIARLIDKAGQINPRNIIDMSVEEIKSCGMSMRKAGYIHGIAKAADEGYFDNVSEMNDEDIVKHLIKLNGIGVWSAEMLLIFSLNRPDVLSFGDLGIRRGITILHGLKEEPNKKEFEIYRQMYSPYASTASLYFWQIAGEAAKS